jgi:hypothetical protein
MTEAEATVRRRQTQLARAHGSGKQGATCERNSHDALTDVADSFAPQRYAYGRPASEDPRAHTGFSMSISREELLLMIWTSLQIVCAGRKLSKHRI